MSTATHSAIIKPANPERVQLFRVAAKTHTLGFEQRPLSGKGVVNIWQSNTDPVKVPSPVLLASSAIVTLAFDDVVHVYSVHAETKLVTLVSPYVDPVSPPLKSTSGYIAGCTNSDGTNAYVYYQEATSNGAQVIKFSDVSDSNSNSGKINATEIKPNTWLGAIWDTRRAWVFYQKVDNIIIAYNTNQSTTSSVHDQREYFIPQTPIGVVFVPNKDLKVAGLPDFKPEALGRVFVYYINNVNSESILYRSWGDIFSKDTTIKFGDPAQVSSQAIGVQADAQISVVADKDARANRLFVAKIGDQDKVNLVTDRFHYGAENEGVAK
ncbi:hypothetical protein F5882DRAFT_445761 [Hyaloscypha sp. PMI_1271]|nr:hypothetical protein F5882DRAFT_445761 [Hyaloscypha sp. PMI_1271]